MTGPVGLPLTVPKRFELGALGLWATFLGFRYEGVWV